MQGDFWVVNSDEKLSNYIAELKKQYEKHKYLTCKIELGKPRTRKQQNALELYCALLAEALNDAGLDMRVVLKPEVKIPWTQASAKNHLWRPIQKIMTGKESSKDPKSNEYGEIYKVLDRHIAEEHHVSVPWPCKENQNAQ